MDRRAWLREAVDLPDKPVETAPATGMDRHEADAWAEDCERWLLSCCTADMRACQSVGSLHVAFCEWTLKNGSLPCRRHVFEELLNRLGVPCLHGFTQGLILSADLKVLKECVTR